MVVAAVDEGGGWVMEGGGGWARGTPITISVRGAVAFWPERSGHWLTESCGGKPAAAAGASVGSTPAMAA